MKPGGSTHNPRRTSARLQFEPASSPVTRTPPALPIPRFLMTSSPGPPDILAGGPARPSSSWSPQVGVNWVEPPTFSRQQRPPCSVSRPVPSLLVCASEHLAPSRYLCPRDSSAWPPRVNSPLPCSDKRVSPSSRFSDHKRYRDAGGHRTGRRPAGSHGRDCSAQAHAWLWTH